VRLVSQGGAIRVQRVGGGQKVATQDAPESHAGKRYGAVVETGNRREVGFPTIWRKGQAARQHYRAKAWGASGQTCLPALAAQRSLRSPCSFVRTSYMGLSLPGSVPPAAFRETIGVQ
jgi:hypothetical protein